ncbi:hypothetical protein ACTFIY_008322 [Dictyostelium cf. discoideum]
MVVDEISIVIAPINYNDNEACTLPVSTLTPWYSLISIGNLKKDDWVLIEGTENVSLYPIQISHSFGAKTIVLTSSQEKEKVLKLGATHVINYKTSQWERNIMVDKWSSHSCIKTTRSYLNAFKHDNKGSFGKIVTLKLIINSNLQLH